MPVRRTIPNGLFITLEGPEGGGKTTQASRLAGALRQRGFEVCETREPGGTPLGEELRSLVKHFGGPGAVCPEAELLLFGASRAQLMRAVILPHLARGGAVVCDRFADSTTVYQGFVRGLDPEFIERLHRLTVGERWPDLTLLLDVDASAGLRRTAARSQASQFDRLEAEPREFHDRVRDGFLRLADAHPARIRVVDAGEAPDQVHRQMMEVVDRVIG